MSRFTLKGSGKRVLLGSVISLVVLSAAQAAPTLAPVAIKPMQATAVKPLSVHTLQFRVNPQVLKHLRPITPGSATPKGPDPDAYVSLVNHMDSGDVQLLEDIKTIAGWDTNLIFQDQSSGNVFYYLPRTFLLAHTENGYAAALQYNSAAEAGDPSVLFSVDLAAPYRTGDTALLKQVLQQVFETTSDIQIRDIGGTGIHVDVDSLSNGLSLPAERITAQAPKHLRETIRLTFRLTQDEAEALLTQIAHEGISGTLGVPVGKKTISIPWNIRFREVSHEPIKGFDRWWPGLQAGDQLVNQGGYPLVVKGIHAYTVENGALKRETKPFSRPFTLEPGTQRAFTLPMAESLLGKNIVIAWLDTEWDTDCAECARAIRTEIERGVAAAPTVPILFEAIPTLFEEHAIYKLIVQVKSPYFIADASKVTDKQVVLTEEAPSHTLALFYPDGKSEPLLFKYRIKIIMQSGETILSPEWVNAKEMELILGAYQITPLLESAQ